MLMHMLTYMLTHYWCNAIKGNKTKRKEINMNILGILGKVAGAVLPSLNKQKKQAEAVDTLLSKRGQVTKVEVILALGYKYIRLFAYCYMIWAIVNDKVSWGELVKILVQ